MANNYQRGQKDTRPWGTFGEGPTAEHIFIPVGVKHRIENASDGDVEFIEVQAGDNLDENDIVRLEDVYGRV